MQNNSIPVHLPTSYLKSKSPTEFPKEAICKAAIPPESQLVARRTNDSSACEHCISQVPREKTGKAHFNFVGYQA